MRKSLHSICRWTFNPGKGGFVPADIRPEWGCDNFDTVKMIQLVKEKISTRIPDNVQLGVELHYDMEVNEQNALEVADATRCRAIPGHDHTRSAQSFCLWRHCIFGWKRKKCCR